MMTMRPTSLVFTLISLSVPCLGALVTSPAVAADFPRFQAQEIDPYAGAIVYAVTVADVDGNNKPDVVAVTEDTVVWYENPGWARHDIIRKATVRDNVCIQPYDIDGDGKIDFALGAGWHPSDMKNPSTLQWLGRDAEGRWQVHPIRYDEPTLHRLRWGTVKGEGTGKKQLVVAALQGRGTRGPNWGIGEGVRVLVYDVPEKPTEAEWPSDVADSSLHTIHNLQLIDLNGDRRDEIVLAAWEGVFVLERNVAGRWTRTRIGQGNQESQPSKGSSEVKVGRLQGGGSYVATIEPWHGFQAVIYTPPSKSAEGGSTPPGAPPPLWSRTVIAEPLQWGHAVWCANLDDDGDEELIIGQRDPNKAGTSAPRGPGVFVFDPRSDAQTGALSFERHTVDDGGVGCEDAMAADLDGDGRLDIIAGGRSTHNVRIYWNRREAGR
jgi:hypothetical protein